MTRALERITMDPLCRVCAISSSQDGKTKVEIFTRFKWPERRTDPIPEWDDEETERDPKYDFIRSFYPLRRTFDEPPSPVKAG
jgi:hypothetical protein